MLFLRLIGILFWIIAAFLLVTEIIFLISGYGVSEPLGQLWFQINSSGLNLTQAIIQRYIAPGLWDYIFLPLLLMPAWKSLTAPALLFLVAGTLLQKIRRKKRSFR